MCICVRKHQGIEGWEKGKGGEMEGFAIENFPTIWIDIEMPCGDRWWDGQDKSNLILTTLANDKF